MDRIQSVATLTTLKVDVADAISTELRGHTGGVKAVLVVRGSITVGVDLSGAQFAEVDERAHSAVIILPIPKVQSVLLDHDRTKLLGIWSTGVWTIVPGGADADVAAVNDAYREAQQAIARVADDTDLMVRARRHAEQVLEAFLRALGWTVKIRWT